MKTDLKILWVDDNKDFVESLRPQLIRWMDDLGFGLLIEWHKGESGIYEALAKKDIELIVLDYRLKGAKNGDEIIKEIRERDFYEDIVFYTTGKTPDDLFDKSPDGVFFVPRGDVKDRVKSLIDLKIRRASDLATLRGWIVADAIELETLLGRVLAKCFGESEALFTSCVLLQEHLFDFYKKHMVLNSLLHDRIAELQKPGGDPKKLAGIKACKKILDAFSDEVVHIRNALAHQPGEDSETGHRTFAVKGKTKKFLNTPESCVQVRKNIRKHRENLLALASLL